VPLHNDEMPFFRDRFETLSFSANAAPGDGLILEFGVATGATINHLANNVALRGRTIYGFDSFKGLPERWSSHDVGHFASDLPDVAANVELVIGLFADTIPAFLATHEGNAALIHLDCDLYSSTWLVLHLLNKRIVPGTIIQLDEYWIVPEHERRAFHDWIISHDRSAIRLARSSEQLVVMME
jgi:hypothetical protein